MDVINSLLQFLLLLSAHSAAQTIRQMVFYRNANPANPTGGLEPLLTPGQVSDVACGSRCMDAFPACTSYLHNASSGVCQLSATPEALLTSLMAGNGDLYATCDTSDDFVLVSYGTSTACVKALNLSRFKTNYTEAAAYCNAMNSNLATVRTRDKLLLLNSIMGSYHFWVGLDDMDEEGVYRWADDDSVAFTVPSGAVGREVSAAEMPGIWNSNEPNNYQDNEDCIQAKYTVGVVEYMLNDYRCSSIARFPCERRIVFV